MGPDTQHLIGYLSSCFPSPPHNPSGQEVEPPLHFLFLSHWDSACTDAVGSQAEPFYQMSGPKPQILGELTARILLSPSLDSCLWQDLPPLGGYSPQPTSDICVALD